VKIIIVGKSDISRGSFDNIVLSKIIIADPKLIAIQTSKSIGGKGIIIIIILDSAAIGTASCPNFIVTSISILSLSYVIIPHFPLILKTFRGFFA